MIERYFILDEKGALAATAQWLLDHAREDQSLGVLGNRYRVDLSGFLVVVPGKRAGRRLIEVLVQRLETQGQALLPPQLTTIAGLGDELYDAPIRPVEDDLTRSLLWALAIKQLGVEQLEPLLGGQSFDTEDERSCQALGRRLSQLHREVTGQGEDFASIHRQVIDLQLEMQADRWGALAEIQSAYLMLLEERGLDDRDQCRLQATREGGLACEEQIVLSGMLEIPRVIHGMLIQLDSPVHVLIHADQSDADYYDALGTVQTELWQDRRIALSNDQLISAQHAEDEARAMVRKLSELSGDRAELKAADISICLHDETGLDVLDAYFQAEKVNMHRAQGRRLSETGPAVLLSRTQAYLRRGWVEDLFHLLRHPVLEAWLLKEDSEAQEGLFDEASRSAKTGRLLEQFDQLYQETLQVRFSVGDLQRRLKRVHERMEQIQASPTTLDEDPALRGEWIGLQQQQERLEVCRDVLIKLEAWLAPLRENSPRPIREWAAPILQSLFAIYDELDQRSKVGSEGLESCDAIFVECRALDWLDEDLAAMMPCDAGTAIGMVLQALEQQYASSEVYADAVHQLGWLELTMDDAPVLLIGDMNEGLVPEARLGDAYLPDNLCYQLGLRTNQDRYARDAAVLTQLLATREVTLFVCRRAMNGEGRLPSRLLLNDEADVVSHRLLHLIESTEGAQASHPWPKSWMPGENAFHVPEPAALKQAISSLRVTQFRDFLDCPFRFYLGQVLGLQQVDTQISELDAMTFGSLLHEAVAGFALPDSGVRESRDAEEIEEWLTDYVAGEIKQRYRDEAEPAVEVQMEQLRLRLRAFAQWQAMQRSQGWRIQQVEWQPVKAIIPVDGEAFGLRGRIDRIDQHEDGRLRIYDYKSSEKAKDPSACRKKDGTWTDLQLPLYRWLLRELYGDEVPAQQGLELGYIRLHNKAYEDAAGMAKMAQWDLEQLHEADECARDVIRQLRQAVDDPGVFALRPEDVGYDDVFSFICQDQSLKGKEDDDE